MFVLLYVLIINLVGCFVMYVDKSRARNQQYRIAEKTLWTIAAIGGALGATVGMEVFRHKTKHVQFKWGLPLLAAVQMAILTYFILQS